MQSNQTTYRKVLASALAFLALGGVHAYAEDLTVAHGETVEITTAVTYDTLTVHGVLRIAESGKVTATTVNLGPDSGDQAVIDIAGKANTTSFVASQVTIGAAGGQGLVRAMKIGEYDVVGWASGAPRIAIQKLTVAADAAVNPESGYIEVLELGSGTLDLTTFTNNSTQHRARVRVKDGRIGSTTAAWHTQLFTGKFLLEAYDATSVIRIGVDYSRRWLGSDLIIREFGKGVRFVQACNEAAMDQVMALSANVKWECKGNVVFEHRNGSNAKVMLFDGSSFPYGPDAGNVILSGKYNTIILENNAAVRLNGLVDQAVLSTRTINTVSGTGQLIFGDGDANGVLNGKIDSRIKVVKMGTGVLRVNGATTLATMDIQAGTVEVTAPITVEQINLASGATLKIDGQKIKLTKPGTFDGNVQLLNGAEIFFEYDSQDSVREVGKSYGQWLVKTGAGGLIIEDPVVLNSRMTVKEGSVAFSATGYDIDLFKFKIISDSSNGASGSRISLAELAVIDANSGFATRGISAGAATTPADLPAGKGRLSSDWIESKVNANSWGISGLFDLRFYSVAEAQCSSFGEGKDVAVYFRLPAGKTPVVGYDFAIGDWGVAWITAWEMLGSVDNGETWISLGKGSATQNATPQCWQSGLAVQNNVTTLTPHFRFSSSDPRLVRSGVKNMPEVMQVQVDGNATLDFTSVTGGQQINELGIDMQAGAGKLMNARFASNGTIALTDNNGLVASALANVEIPLELVDCTDVGEMRNWRISLNGNVLPENSYRVFYRSGKLKFFTPGTCIIVR